MEEMPGISENWASSLKTLRFQILLLYYNSIILIFLDYKMGVD